MRDVTALNVKVFRWIVLLLASGFWLSQFTTALAEGFGLQFRFLTVWGLTVYVVIAALMLRNSHNRSDESYNTFVSAGVVLAAVVVFMFWKLWFTDPSLVSANGPNVWYQTYYLHALGPALVALDAFFILGAFVFLGRTFIAVLMILIPYILWLEILVAPFNSVPLGTVVSGLPYPFLNNMEQTERLGFYGTVIVTAVVFTLVGWVISKAISRVGRRLENTT
jgi:hypothetical protein